MRKSLIICDCCGDIAKNLNQVSTKSKDFSHNYELCDDCMERIVSVLTRYENRQRLTGALRDDPLEDVDNSIFDNVQD